MTSTPIPNPRLTEEIPDQMTARDVVCSQLYSVCRKVSKRMPKGEDDVGDVARNEVESLKE
jgi:hypothetical protein